MGKAEGIKNHDQLQFEGRLKELPLNQFYIDIRKISVIEQLWNRIKRAREKEKETGQDHSEELWQELFRPQYLWYRSKRLTDYELRAGEPPPDRERPEYLRKKNLRVDVREFLERFRRGYFEDGKLSTVPVDQLKAELLDVVRGD